MRKGFSKAVAVTSALAMVFSFTPISTYLPEQAGVKEAKAEFYDSDEYETISVDEVKQVEFTEENYEKVFSFTPETSGTYDFIYKGSLEVFGFYVDSDGAY
jgi:hypothetical protein